MLFHAHLLLGIVFFLISKHFLLGDNTVVFFLIVLLGSILPDIDEPSSKITQWSGIIGKIISSLAKHRGFFHSLLFFAVSALLISYFWNGYYALALFIGYLAHLLGDGITPLGVQVFYPFSSFKLRGPIRTGGVIEFLVIIGLVILIIKELL